jgi:hypothetical protein
MLDDLHLTPERAAKAVAIIARLRRVLAAERQMDERVQRSLDRLLPSMVRAEVDRAMGRN